jgi:ABC-type lipoprotein release transport system permease subunit
VLGVLLAVLALVAVAHAVVTAVRRRTSELAVLKVLGFTRGEIRATVAWQATIIGAVGLVLGIPTGIVLGRWVWNLVADGLGVLPAVANPVLAMLVLVPVALLVVNLVAFLPARTASRTRPAVALREA